MAGCSFGKSKVSAGYLDFDLVNVSIEKVNFLITF